MGLFKKILIGTGIGAVVVGGIAYVRRLTRTANELIVVPTVKIHKLTLQGLILRVDVKLKNPTQGQVKFKFPFVKLMYKDAAIGSSQSIDKDILIPKYGEVFIDAIMIDIPLLGVFSLANDLLKAVESGEGVKMTVKTISTIDLGWKKLPYEDSQEITLKK